MADIIVAATTPDQAQVLLDRVSRIWGRLGWHTGQVTLVNLSSSTLSALPGLVTPGARICAVVDSDHTINLVKAELAAVGWSDARVEVVDGPDLKQTMVISIVPPNRMAELGTSPGLPDSAFENDGQLTKREIRAIALADLRPIPGQLMWDLGAGAGSVGIEWALHHPANRTIAVERNPQRAARIRANALKFGLTGIEVCHGPSMELVDQLAEPDAVFIGGGARLELVDLAYRRLRPGGRLVVHTVTLESDVLLVEARARYGGNLRRISVERAEPLGRYLSWTPARAITHWATTKPTQLSTEADTPAD